MLIDLPQRDEIPEKKMLRKYLILNVIPNKLILEQTA